MNPPPFPDAADAAAFASKTVIFVSDGVAFDKWKATETPWIPPPTTTMFLGATEDDIRMVVTNNTMRRQWLLQKMGMIIFLMNECDDEDFWLQQGVKLIKSKFISIGSVT